MIHLIVFFSSVVFTMTLTPVLIKSAPAWGLVDRPDARKTHKEPIPLVGGPILFPLVFIGLSLAYAGTDDLPYLLIATTTIFTLGIVDDLRGLHFTTKFFVQLIAALLIMQSGALVDLNRIGILMTIDVRVTPIISTIVTLVWIVGITNAINLIDGMDGLASGLCLNASAGIGAVAILTGKPDLALICIILAGGLLGFLRYNTVPARTYLGDSGSMLLGFVLAVISILQSAKTSTFLVLVIPLLLLAVPMADTTLAFFRRVLKGDNPFKPDKLHLHHKLLDLNFSVKQTLGIFYSLSAALGILALWLLDTQNGQIISMALLCVVTVITVIKVMQVYHFHGLITRVNRRIRAIARKAVGRESSNGQRLFRNLIMLVVFSVLNLGLVLKKAPVKGIFIAAIGGLLILGITDIILNRREEKPRYEIQNMVIFLSIVLNQVLFLILLPAFIINSPLYSAAGLVTILIVFFVLFRTGTFATFLQDPVEILGLFLSLVILELVKYHLKSWAMMPFMTIILNALVLYTLSKVYLTGYPVRSRFVMAGMAVFFIVMVGAVWV